MRPCQCPPPSLPSHASSRARSMIDQLFGDDDPIVHNTEGPIVASVQAFLRRMVDALPASSPLRASLDPGPVDGIYGSQTKAAVGAFAQQRHLGTLELEGNITDALLDAMNNPPIPDNPRGAAEVTPAPTRPPLRMDPIVVDVRESSAFPLLLLAGGAAALLLRSKKRPRRRRRR